MAVIILGDRWVNMVAAQQQTQLERRLHAGAIIAIEMLTDAYGSKRGSKSRAYKFVSDEMKQCDRPMAVDSLRVLHWKYGLGELPCKQEVELFLGEHWQAETNGRSAIRCPHGDPIHRCHVATDGRCCEIVPMTEFYVRGMFGNELFLQTA